jgi:hypothetical protein
MDLLNWGADANFQYEDMIDLGYEHLEESLGMSEYSYLIRQLCQPI